MADALIASSEFDPNGFIKGIDAMTGALEKLSAEEDVIQQKLNGINNALKNNRAELKANQEQVAALDKTSKTYAEDLAKLNQQQTQLRTQQKGLRDDYAAQKTNLQQVNTSALQYKSALEGLNAISKKVQSDNKGKTLFDVASMNKQILEITELGGKLQNVFNGKIDTSELEEFERALAGTTNEMEQLAKLVEFIKPKLQTLDPDSQEFADLSRMIEVAEQVLEEFGKQEEEVGKKSQSLRSRLAEMRTTLVEMEEAGLENTEEFQNLQIEAGKLSDAIGDAQARIKVLASDTKNLDFGLGAIRGVIAAYGVAEGALSLFGIKNEEVTKTIERLNAIMLILNGLQEIQNLLQKQSVVYIVGQEIATKALAVSQAILAATLGTTAAASRALNLALIGTGIGAFIAAIGLLIVALRKWANADEELIKQQKLLNAEMEITQRYAELFIDAIGTAGEQLTADLELRQEQARRIGATDRQALEDRQRNAQEQRDLNRRILQEQLQEAERSERAQQDIYDRSEDRRRAAIRGEIQITEAELDELNKTRDNFNKTQQTKYELITRLEIAETNNLRDQAVERNEIRQLEYDQTQDYLNRLRELRERLVDIQNDQQRQTGEQIAAQGAENLRRELAAISRDVRNGKITSARAQVLKDILRQISGVQVEADLKEFNKRVLQITTQLNDQLLNLQLQAADQRIALTQDDLRRQELEIQASYNRQALEITNARRDALASVNDAFEQGLISEDRAKQNADRIIAVYDRLFSYLNTQRAQAAEALARAIYERLQQDVQATFAGAGVIVSEATTETIIRLSQLYQQGKISYERYQRDLTKITTDESTKRIAQSIRENEELLKAAQERLKVETDPDVRRSLEQQIQQLRNQLSELRRQLAIADAEGTNADTEAFKKKIEVFVQYAQAIGGLVNQVVQFWSQMNQAETEALDRSIALQERRVDAATRIAERGNAEYLRLEQDRLDELQIRQENAARRQLAINAVLQTSQALTAFVTALAQGIATGGPLGGIAIAASVIGLIASGYAIIQSLQNNNTQTLAKGTKSVERNGAPAGTDTVPAMLTEGEAVIPRDTNRRYAPAVAAIYDGSIPAEEMNNFVNSYRVNHRNLPQLDHDRMGEVARVIVGHDTQLLAATEIQNRRLAENNELLQRMDKHISTMGVSVNVDRNGLSIMLFEAIKQMRIDKKS